MAEMHELSSCDYSRLGRTLIERAMELRCQSYLAHAKHLLLMQTIMNIEESKRLLSVSNRQMREMDRIKTLFIAGMAHELNNPLTSIIGYSEMVVKGVVGPLNEKQEKYLQSVVASATYMRELVSDAMDIAKIEADVFDHNIEQFNLCDVVNSAITLVACQAGEKGLTLMVKVAPEIRLRSDRRRLQQCLVNLVSNAIKYTVKGGITVVAAVAAKQVTIEVIDTGIGLSAYEQHHIFDAFQRGKSARQSREPGSGIGLYLTRKLVERVLNGTISVSSEVGQGSTFRLQLPQTVATDQIKGLEVCSETE